MSGILNKPMALQKKKKTIMEMSKVDLAIEKQQ